MPGNPAEEHREAPGRECGRGDRHGDDQPTKPLIPLDDTQAEVPKVGTTEAPGG